MWQSLFAKGSRRRAAHQPSTVQPGVVATADAITRSPRACEPRRYAVTDGRWRFTCAGIAVMILLTGCQRESVQEVVVYTALDQEFSAPIFAEFTKKTGIRVRPKFDTEANKTVGLVELILAERHRPRCDVFWNNELLNTLRLDQEKLLLSQQPSHAPLYPPEYRSPQGTWFGFAARARVLLVNTARLGSRPRPQSVRDLSAPQWRGEVGLAKPLFGTTATHAACLFTAWSVPEATAFFRSLRDGQAQVLPGNRQVAQAVGLGQLTWGLTDTDDALLELEQGMPVEIVYPDQASDGLGTLFIPNTLAAVRGCRHAPAAAALIDFLLSPTTEAQLAAGPSGQIPLHRQSDSADSAQPLRTETPRTVRPMRVDFAAAARQWHDVAQRLRDLGY